MTKKLNFERARLRDLAKQAVPSPRKPFVDRLENADLRDALGRAIQGTQGRSVKDYAFVLSLQRHAMKTGILSPKQMKCLGVIQKRIGQ